MQPILRALVALSLAFLAASTHASERQPVAAPWVRVLLRRVAPKPFVIPSHPETQEQYEVRLTSISEAIAEVSHGPKEAALLVAVAFMETGLAADADVGPCYRGRDGRSTRCDSGQAASLWQIKIGAGSTHEGWTQADLFADRKKAATSARNLLRRSVRACKGADAGLDVYAGGRCAISPESTIRRTGKKRIDLARKLFAEHPYPSAGAS